MRMGCLCLCVCVCVCAHTHVYVCVCVKKVESMYYKHFEDCASVQCVI